MKSKKNKNKKRNKYAGSLKNNQPLLTNEEIEEIRGSNFNKLPLDEKKLRIEHYIRVINAKLRQRGEESGNNWVLVNEESDNNWLLLNEENAPITQSDVVRAFIELQRAYKNTDPKFKKLMREKYHTNSEEWVGNNNSRLNEIAKLMNNIAANSKVANNSITQQRRYNSTLSTPPKRHYLKQSLKSLKKKLFGK